VPDSLRVITVMARSADGDLALPDGNVFLREAYDTLNEVAARNRKSFGLKLVNSVNEIRNAVEAFSELAPKPILQIIGHGRPGELDLGRAWTQTIRDNVRFYVIDNNSRELSLLAQGAGSFSEVRLVACNVGGEEGLPLLFTLAHMFRCDVTAAATDVSVSMFNNTTGLYEGEMIKCDGRFRTFSRISGRPMPLGTRGGTMPSAMNRAKEVQRITFHALRYVRNLSLASQQRVSVDLTSDESRALWSWFRPLGVKADGATVVELALDASFSTSSGDSGKCVVEILSNRCARLLPEDPSLFDSQKRWSVDAGLTSSVLRAVRSRYQQAWLAASMPVILANPERAQAPGL
jgi:Domain of unknown function (DUF4347)